MARTTRTHVVPPQGNETDYERGKMVRKHVTKQEFARRLFQAMQAKGWTQAELARQSDVARGLISKYLKATNLPEPTTLKRIANALDVKAADLMPNYDASAALMEVEPALQITASAGDPSRSWIKINREVSTRTVSKLMQVLDEDDAK